MAKMFWWYDMYADVDYAVTPRPIYRADGRQLPDIHAAFREEYDGHISMQRRPRHSPWRATDVQTLLLAHLFD